MKVRLTQHNNIIGMRTQLSVKSISPTLSKRKKSSIDGFFSLGTTGNESLDNLKQLVYSPLVGEAVKNVDNSQRVHEFKKLQSARYFATIMSRFPVTMVFKIQPSVLQNDRISINREFEKLNNFKNLEILKLNEYEKKFLDPNHLMRLYDVMEINFTSAFNLALCKTKEELQNQAAMKKLRYSDQLQLDSHFSYMAILLSRTALYLDSTRVFEILERFKDVYQLHLIRVNKDSLNTKILTARDELELLSYDNLLSYAKGRHQHDTKELKNDENYLQLFTKFGELGFIETRKSDKSLYLTKK